MSDPKRWLDEGGGATFEERALLQAGRAVRMPGHLRTRVWAGVATGLAGLETAVEAAGALQKGAAAKSALSLLSSTAAKGLTAVALASGVGFGVAALRSPSEPPAATHVTRVTPSVTANSKAALPPPAELTALREPESAAPAQTATPSSGGIKSRALQAARPAARATAPSPPRRGPVPDEVQPAEVSQESR